MRRQIVSTADTARARAEPGLATADPGTGRVPASTGTSDATTPDDYKAKLLKLIPAEAVAAYVTLDGIIRSSASGNGRLVGLWVAFAVGLIGTPLYLWRLQGVTLPVQLAISTVSFAIWVFAVGGAFALYGWYQPWIASVVLVAYTFLVPGLIGPRQPSPAAG